MTQALPVALPLTPYLPQPGQSGHIWLVRTAAVLAAVSLANSVAPAVGQVRRYLLHLLRQPRCEFTFPEASGSGPDENYDLIRLYLSNLDIPRMQR